MDYSKVITIDKFDFSKIQDKEDFPERLQQIKSYLGSYNWNVAKAIPRSQRRIDTNRRVKRDQKLCIEHFQNLADEYMRRINLILEGEPLENVKGKLKIATSMPPSTKHSARYHIHQERLNKKRAKRKMRKMREKESQDNFEKT